MKNNQRAVLPFLPEASQSKVKYIIGCDEVGRGCLAGPVVAATVCFEVSNENEIMKLPWAQEIRDSKIVNENDRKILYELIKQNSLCWSVAEVNSKKIDEINIHHASLLAMEKATNELHTKLKKILFENSSTKKTTTPKLLDHATDTQRKTKKKYKSDYSIFSKANASLEGTLLLIDGKFLLPNYSHPQIAVVDGDAKNFCIASASIIAKVYRDNLMTKLDTEFPEYGFKQHKGYGTKQHKQAIAKLGALDLHRKSFKLN